MMNEFINDTIKYDKFISLLKWKKGGIECLVTINLNNLGIYERNLKLIFRMQGTIKNWKIIVTEILIEMFPEKKKDINNKLYCEKEWKRKKKNDIIWEGKEGNKNNIQLKILSDKKLEEALENDYLTSEIFLTQSQSMLEEILKLKGAINDNLVTIIQAYSKSTINKIIEYINNKVYKNKKIVRFDCASFSNELDLEKDLFGYVNGYFSDSEGKLGKIEFAAGSLLFLENLDHVTNPSTQDKIQQLIDVENIEKFGFSRLGEKKLREPNVWVIASVTNDIKELISHKYLSKKLFDKFEKFICILPLNQRREDILFLIEYYNRKKMIGLNFSIPVLKSLYYYEWEDDIDELKNLLENIFNNIKLSNKTMVEINDLPDNIPKLLDINEGNDSDFKFMLYLNKLRNEESGYNKKRLEKALDEIGRDYFGVRNYRHIYKLFKDRGLNIREFYHTWSHFIRKSNPS